MIVANALSFHRDRKNAKALANMAFAFRRNNHPAINLVEIHRPTELSFACVSLACSVFAHTGLSATLRSELD